MLLAINHGCTVAEAAAAARMNTLRENFVNAPARSVEELDGSRV
jgi:hypothetical protein